MYMLNKFYLSAKAFSPHRKHFYNPPKIPLRVQIQKEREKEKKEAFYDSLPVEQLLKMGYYDTSSKPEIIPPFGIDFWIRRVESEDWQILNLPTLSVAPPLMFKENLFEEIGGKFHEPTQSYYWSFKQKSAKIVFYCAFHLLLRISKFPHWQQIEQNIPVFWTGTVKTKELCNKILLGINQNNVPNITLTLNFPDSLSLNEIRHNYTPYDYLWQTGLMPRDDAYEHWNERIKLVQKKYNDPPPNHPQPQIKGTTSCGVPRVGIDCLKRGKIRGSFPLYHCFKSKFSHPKRV